MVRLIGDASAWLSRCRADDAGPGGARKAPRRLRLPLRLLVGGAPSQVTFRQSHGPARHSRGEIIRCLRPAVRWPTAVIELPIALLVTGDAT